LIDVPTYRSVIIIIAIYRIIHKLQRVSQELDYRIDICRVTKGAHIEHLQDRTETLSVSPSVDMLTFGVTIPATVPQGSEIPEGLTNNPIYSYILVQMKF
jgi:hypothetical protein